MREADWVNDRYSIKVLKEEKVESADSHRVLAAAHYAVSGSFGASRQAMTPSPIVVDTGSGFNVVRKDVLPSGWRSCVIPDAELPDIGDANGNPLPVLTAVWLRVRFGNAQYKVPFLVVENLACPMLVGTHFTNRHVDAIWCRLGRIQFTRATLPILGRGTKAEPWNPEKSDDPALRPPPPTDESASLTGIRLARPVSIAPYTQVKAYVTTNMGGIIVTEPKHSLFQRHKVRIMNGVHDVLPGKKFPLLVSNFSSRTVNLPKHPTIAYASRSPLTLVSLSGAGAQELCAGHNIFLTNEEALPIEEEQNEYVVPNASEDQTARKRAASPESARERARVPLAGAPDTKESSCSKSSRRTRFERDEEEDGD